MCKIKIFTYIIICITAFRTITMEAIYLKLSKSQEAKARNLRTFQVRAGQDGTKSDYTILVSKPVARKFKTSIRNNKGMRFSEGMYTLDNNDDDSDDDTIEGGRIRWKKLGRRIKRGAKKASKVIKTQAVTAIKQHGRQALQIAASKAIDLGAEAAKAGVAYYAPGAAPVANKVIERAASKGKQSSKSGISRLNGKEFNGGKLLSRPVAGSQAAKDKMAALRAMRKPKKTGSGFRPVGVGFRPIHGDGIISGEGFMNL